jgi:predicted hydrocarbon binding protein
LQELKRYIFMEWYSAATQACYDTLGSEDANRMFQPYNILSGHAIVINLDAKNRFPHIQSDLLRASVQLYYIYPLVWLAKISNGFLTANSFSADVTRCAMQNEMCEGCNSAGQAQVETINPDFLFNCDMGLRKGLNRCKFTIRKKGGNVEPIEEATTCLLPVRVTEEEIDFWPIHFLSGYWYYATTIMIDSLGEEKTKEILGPYMEHAGTSVALMLKKELEIEENDARGIGTVIDFLNNANSQIGQMTQFTPNVVTKTINQCPFSTMGSPMCYQYEKIGNGVCKAINQKYEFRHEKMMTKGDSHCQWVVSKR